MTHRQLLSRIHPGSAGTVVLAGCNIRPADIMLIAGEATEHPGDIER